MQFLGGRTSEFLHSTEITGGLERTAEGSVVVRGINHLKLNPPILARRSSLFRDDATQPDKNVFFFKFGGFKLVAFPLLSTLLVEYRLSSVKHRHGHALSWRFRVFAKRDAPSSVLTFVAIRVLTENFIF